MSLPSRRPSRRTRPVARQSSIRGPSSPQPSTWPNRNSLRRGRGPRRGARVRLRGLPQVSRGRGHVDRTEPARRVRAPGGELSRASATRRRSSSPGLVWTPRSLEAWLARSRRVRRGHDDGVHRLPLGRRPARSDRLPASCHAVGPPRVEKLYTRAPSFRAQPTEIVRTSAHSGARLGSCKASSDTPSSTGFLA